MHHTKKCPKCKTMTSAIHLYLVEDNAHVCLHAKRIAPLYCPLCGYPIAQNELLEEAERAIRNE